MIEKTIRPIRLPRNLEHLMASFPEESRQKVADIPLAALAEDRWRAVEEGSFDSGNLEVIACYVRKTRVPTTKPKAGFAAIVPLVRLNRMPFDAETTAYIDKINEYADLVLSDTWRDKGDSAS